MKRALIVLFVALPQLAEAHHNCYEVSPVVGYARCSRFGWWSHGAPMWWEAGLVSLRFDPGHIDAMASSPHADGTTTLYHVTSIDDVPVTAVGLGLSATIGFPHGFYLANRMVITSVTGGPHLVADVVERGMTTTMDTRATGTLTQGTLGVGAAFSLGAITARTELTPGFRIATFKLQDLPDTVRGVGVPWFVLDVREKLDFWLTPNITLGADAAVNVLARGDYMLGLMVGLHISPYDGER